jgi:hypothetical protein
LDAFTFNKTVRLPAAQAKAMGLAAATGVPSSALRWAEELAADGYEGVIAVHQVDDETFIATRKSGLPVAVTVKQGVLEASAASGPWAHIAMALCTSPTLSLTTKAVQ